MQAHCTAKIAEAEADCRLQLASLQERLEQLETSQVHATPGEHCSSGVPVLSKVCCCKHVWCLQAGTLGLYTTMPTCFLAFRG